jgi:hypothetical protein
MHALAFNIFMAPLVETITTLCHFYALVKVNLPLFINDFHLEMDFILDKEANIYVLMCSPCLSFSSPSSMVYELLWDSFVPDDFINGFDLWNM